MMPPAQFAALLNQRLKAIPARVEAARQDAEKALQEGTLLQPDRVPLGLPKVLVEAPGRRLLSTRFVRRRNRATEKVQQREFRRTVVGGGLPVVSLAQSPYKPSYLEAIKPKIQARLQDAFTRALQGE